MAKFFHQFSFSQLFQRTALSLFNFTFKVGVAFRAIKSVNQRALSTLTTTLVLSAFLTACSGGGGGGGGTPAPAVPSPSLSLAVTSSTLTLSEDFSPAIRIATATTTTDITVSQSTTGVVTVTTSDTGVSVLSILNVSGRTTLTITASSNTLSTTAQVVVQVTAVNDPPTLAVSSNSISTVSGFSPITFNTTASDVEDSTLSFTVSDSNPGVVRVTTSANAITLSAIAGGSGQTTLVITAVDSSGSTVTQTIAVIVFNRAPVLTVFTSLISLQEDYTDIVAFIISATDFEGDTITLSVSSTTHLVDAAISTLTNGASAITLSAIDNANGTTTLTVHATAAGQSVSTNVVVVLAPVNDTPTITVSSSSISTVGGFSPITINTTASDIEDGTLPFTVSDSNPGVVTVTTSANAITLNPIPGDSAKTTLTVRTADRLGTTVTRTISVNVINSTPVLMISTHLISLQEDFNASVLFGITATDLDGDALTLSVSSTTHLVNAAISTPTMSTITLSAINNANGTTTLTIQAMDAIGQSVSTNVVVVVAPVNDTPTLTVSSNSISTMGSFSPITINTTASDIEDGTLPFTVSDSNPGVVSVTTSANAITLSAIPGGSGQTILTITAVDSLGSTVTQTISVSVFNRAPVLTVFTSLISLQEDFTDIVAFIVSATDLDGDTITLSVSSTTHLVDAAISTLTNGVSAITLTAINNANGTTTLTVQATAAGQTVSTNVVVVLAPVNDTPTITVSSNSISTFGGFSTITINTTASDIEDSTLSFTVSAFPTGVVTVSQSTNAITLNAISEATGQTILTVRTADRLGTTVTRTIAVNVVNSAPVLTVSTSLISVQEDFKSSVMFSISATDIDGDVPAFSVRSTTRLVDAAISTPINGVSTITLTAIDHENGTTVLTVQATAAGQSVSTNVVVVVAPVNDPPSLAVSSNSISTVGGFSPITINTTASDIEDDNISFTVIDAKTGVVRVTTSTNAIVLNTIPGASGQTTLTLSVVDSSGAAVTEIITVSVSIMISTIPVVTVSTNWISVQEDFETPVIIQTTATDADVADTISVSVSASRAIVTAVISTPVNGQSTITNRITLTAIDNVNGTATLTVLVGDLGGQSHSTEIVVVVSPVQDAPTLNIPSVALTVAEDFASTQTIATASDDDGDPLLLSVVESTTGVVTVSTTASGVLVSSLRNANGQTTLTITVNDGTQDTTAQVVINVTPLNDPPTLAIPRATLTVFEDFVGAMTVATASDVDGNTLTFTVIESTTGVIGVTALASDVRISSRGDANGVTTLSISVNDGEISTTAQVVVTVTPVNDPPALSVSTDNISANVDFSAITINTTASDIEDGTLSFTVTASTTNVVRVSQSANAITLNAISGATGQTILTVRAADRLGTTVTRTISVNVINRAPVLTVFTSLISLQEDFTDLVAFIVSATDLDGDTITLSVSSTTHLVDAAISTLTNGVSAITLTAIDNANGTTTLTVQATAAGQTVSTNVVVVVAPVNDTPTLTVSSNSITTFGGFSTITINTTASDIEDRTLSFTVTASNENVVTVTTSANAILLNAISEVTGQTTLTVRTADSLGTTVTQTIAVNVANSAPVLVVSTSLISVQEDFITSVMFSITATDIDGDTITLSVSSTTHLVDAALSTLTNGVSTITLTTIDHDNGTATLTVQATAAGQSVSTNVVVVVAPVNDTPTLTVTTNSITTFGGFSTIIINTTASDIEDSTLSFTVTESTANVVAVTTSANAILLNAIPFATGQTTLTVRTADSLGTTVTQTIAVNVINSAPVLTVSTSLISLQEDFMTSFMFSITATDIDGDAITILVSSSSRLVDAVLSTPISGQSTIALTAIDHENGTTTLTVQATAAGQSVTTNVVVVVVPVNDTPTLTVSSNSITTFGGFSTITINTTASDIEDSTLSFTVTASAPGVVTVTTSANAITLNAISEATGQTTLTVRTADSLGTTVTQTIAVNVANSAPVLTVSTSLISLQEDFTASVMFSITATDIDGDAITLSVSSITRLVDAALSTPINGQSTITLTAIDHENGTTTLMVQATAAGLSVSTNVVVVVVPVNDTPTLTVSTNSITTFGGFSTITINTTASDIEDSTLSFTVSAFPTGVVTVTTSANAILLNAIPFATGQTTLTVRTADSLGTTVTQTIVVNVINSAPVLTVSTRLISLQEDFMTSVMFSFTATDIDGDAITILVSSSSRVVNAALSTPINGQSTITLSAIDHENGTTTLTVQATAAGQSVSTNVVVVVAPVNDTPTLTVSSNSITTVGRFSTITINTTASDIEDSTLSFSVLAFPTGVVRVTTSANAITLNAIANATGQTTLTVRTADLPGTAITRTIAVNVLNSAPVLTVSTSLISVQEDFTASVMFSITATDIDGDTITISVSSTTRLVDAALSTPISGQSTITLTAIDHENGTTTLTVQATAVGQSVSTNLVVVVVPVNDTPTLTVTTNSITTFGGFSTITINTTASDIEDSTLSFSVTESTANVVTVTTSANAILLNAISGATGQTTLTLRTADSLGTTVTQTISVNVLNSAPILTVSTRLISLQEDFMTSVMFRITATDIDGDAITLSVSSTTRLVNAALSTPISGQSTIALTAIDHENGTTTLTVQATADGQSVSTNVVVVVAPVNDTPTLTVSTNIITTAGGFSTIIINTTASDIEDSTLSFTVSAFPTGLVTVTTSANAILLNAVSGATGQTTLNVRTADSLGTTVTQTISVNVINSAPVLTISTSLISLQEDFMTSVMFSITATDIDGDAITISVSSTTHLVDAALSTPINGQSTIALTAIDHENGTTTLTVQATAAGQSVSTNVEVVVVPVNDTPTLTVSSNSITIVGEFSTITINTTASDIEDRTLSFSVSAFPTGVVTVTTSANAITLNEIPKAIGRTTITVRTADSLGTTVIQTISVNVINSAPVLVVSTNRISVQEDFMTSVVIRTTATDAEGDTITLSVSSTSRLVDVAISTPINGKSTITNSITLTAINNANGTTTLTVQATDIGGQSTFTEIVVVVNGVYDPIPFTLSTSAVNLSVHGSQLERIINAIRISNPDNNTLRAQIGVTASGDNIFSANPIPVVSFTTNALTTTATLTSVASTAQLYFTVAPNSIGTATLVVQLTDLDSSIMTQQTMVVQVDSVNLPPTIVPTVSSITNLVVHGGRLYANASLELTVPLILEQARSLGGHLMNINSVEEFDFVRGVDVRVQNAWFGLALPQPIFPGELSWITHDSTIAYGYANANGAGNLTVYPGHFPLNWNAGTGLNANRSGTNVFNWTVYSSSEGFFLLGDSGDANRARRGFYEFPQGMTPTTINPTALISGTNALISLTGFDLNGDAINTNDWSITDPNGGTATFNNVSRNSGVQIVTMIYTAPANFSGQTTVAVTLQVNGLSSTYPISFIVDGPPSIALSTNVITLNEDFGAFDIGTTVTDQGVSTNLPFWVSASTSGIVTISTSANNIQLSSVQNANGPVTLTVQSIDSVSQSTSALIVVNVQAVNDTPTLTLSTNSISILGGVLIVTIDTTATDVEDGPLSFSVQSSTTGMLSITTSANAIALDSIYNASVQTTLTVTAVDTSNTTVVQTIAVNVIITQSATPVLTVSTNLIRVDEDFSNPVVIRTTATDAEGGTITLSVSSSSHIIDAVISAPINGVSTITNSITLTSLTDLNGTTTLTVRATDGGGISSTEQIVVVVNPVDDAISFTLSTSTVSLSAPGSQLDRVVNGINISNPGNKTLSAQLQVTSSGDPIFSANPTPVASFTTNALTTLTTLTLTTSTAQLYFTIAPNQTGTATLTVHLSNLTTSESTQQTLVVQVNPVNVPPAIASASSNLSRLVVHGGRLYANDATASGVGISRFLTTASALGGHLININSIEEYTFMRSTPTNGLIISESWLGMVLPQQDFPGELSWITHDSTIAYGYSSATGITNHTIYPGHFPLPWSNAVGNSGLDAHRFNRSNTVFNWTIYAIGNGGVFFLVDDVDGSHNRNVIYEFPQGLAPATIVSYYVRADSSATIGLTGFDLNGDVINTSDWSAVATTGTTSIGNIFQSSGVQTVNLIYTAPANFSGPTTVVVTLTVGGLSTTNVISFIVDGPPTIALSTNAITLNEDFGTFVIGTTVTDHGVSGNLPFSVQTTSTGLVNLSTTINSIQFSGASHFNGVVTLTVQTTDSAAQTASTLVVVTVQVVNDTPTVTVSTNNISTLGGFLPITIDTTATDVEDGPLSFSVQASPQGVVSISTDTNAIVLSPIVGGSGRTTLTISALDDGSKTGIQTIAVNVMVTTSASTPVLRVSTNLISLQEDFGSVVIDTTATDVESGTLVVTVSSTTHLVNMVISTHSITLSSEAHLFGTTTLTVRARDDGGVFVSTEIVVIVASVNDTPTLSVLSNAVRLSSASLILDVTASDVEDGVLSFGTSTGQGYVDIAITTTRLTLTRLNQSGQLLLTLTSTDTDGGTTSMVVTVTIPPFLEVTMGIKTLDFAWSAVSATSHYQLRSNPDGNSGFTDLSTTGIVVSPNSTDIKQTTAQGLVSLHRYIPIVTDPQYEVYSCNGSSCGIPIGNMVVLTNAQLNGMIGRLQANNSDSGDLFGWSVDLSGDGNTLAVGAYGERGTSTGVNGVQNNNSSATGAVYLFRRMGGAWSQQAYIKASNPSMRDQFGFSVSLNDDGNTLAVGANLEDGPATGVNGTQNDGTNDSGAVYVFRFSSSTWSQQAYIKASNTGRNFEFGYAVALSGDGNTLAVGSRNEGSSSRGINSIPINLENNSGATYLFRFDGSMWSQQAYIKASNSLSIDRFGQSVSLNKDGNTLVVGAPAEYNLSTGVDGNQHNRAFSGNFAAGAVYLFRFNTTSSVWFQQAYIKASNVFSGARFGWSVDLNDDGNSLAVGAVGDPSDSTGVNGAQNSGSRDYGAAYVFRFSSSTWSQQAYIKASNTGEDDFFGVSVSISGDGNALVVGAQLEDGSAIGVEGNNNASIDASGAAYVFEFANDRWAQQAFIKASDPSDDANYGQSVSISSDGGTIAVGGWGVNTNTGAVYLY